MERRRHIHAEARAEAGDALKEVFAAWWHRYRGDDDSDAHVAGYWPIGDEIDVLPLMQWLEEKGQAVALPALDGPDSPLLFRAWTASIPLEKVLYGTYQPPVSAHLVVPSFLLVPMLAFDVRGDRMGYGGGYYDRTLAALRRTRNIVAMGVAYAGQEFPDVPVENYDEPLDWILTEKWVRKVTKE